MEVGTTEGSHRLWNETRVTSKILNILSQNLIFRCDPHVFISLICCISHIPDINRQIKVFNGGVQPDPIFSVFHSFQYNDVVKWLISLLVE